MLLCRAITTYPILQNKTTTCIAEFAVDGHTRAIISGVLLRDSLRILKTVLGDLGC